MTNRRQAIFGILATMAAASAAAEKPIRLIVPYTAGGPTDATARIIADLAKDKLGPVIIDNKPGAGGNIGADILAKATPDGQTIGIAAFAPHGVNPWLYSKVPYDPIKDFCFITQMVSLPLVLVMNSDAATRLAIGSVRDLVSYARSNPDTLSYASAGNGSPGHLAGEMLKLDGGFKASHIPYNGGGPAQLALMSGQVAFNFDNLATAAPNIRSGKIKTLAVTSAKRIDSMPDVPAIAEFIKGFSIETWWGLAAPAGTPAATIARLNQVFVEALRSPDARQKFATMLIEPVSSTPDEFMHLVKAEGLKYQKLVKAIGARVD